MSLQAFTWALDPAGTNPDNLISGEVKSISPINGINYSYFIPNAAPYHENSMIVVDAVSGLPLTKNVDWEPGLKFDAASNSYNLLPIYGAVVIKNQSLVGPFRITYRTLGGEFVVDTQTLMTELINAMIDPRTTKWDLVTNRPAVYNPANHLHMAADTGSYEAVVAAVLEVAASIASGNGQAWELFQTHLQDMNNPHQINLTKLGIDRFENVYKASNEQLDEKTNDINYTTVAGVTRMVVAALNNYTPNLSSITKTSIGLGNVPNWAPASQADLDAAGSNKFVDPAMVAYIVNKLIQGTSVGQIQSLIDAFNAHAGNQNNPHNLTLDTFGIPLAPNMTGALGQVAFYNGGGNPFDTTSDYILNRLGVATNGNELTALLTTTENFAQVFSSWRRIALRNGNPEYNLAELSNWTFDAATNRISNTTNSTTLVGLVNPELTDGDYVFEVELSSTNADDDLIGILLGLQPVDGKLVSLVAQVALYGNKTTLFLSVDYPNDANDPNLPITEWISNLGLSQNTSSGLTWKAGGWAAIQADGPIKIKAERVGTTLTVSCTNPGSNTYVASLTMQLTGPVAGAFAGPVNLGYSAASQPASSWKTLRRTGALPTVVATHTNAVYEHDGVQYNQVVGKTPSSVIMPGRWYRDFTFERTYYAPGYGSLVLVTANSAVKSIGTTTGINDRVLYSAADNSTVLPCKVTWTYQNPATGAAGSRGRLEKSSPTNLESISPAAADSYFYLGNETNGKKGGIRATDGGVVGFVNAAGAWLAYIQPNGIMQHNGMNKLSDPAVKESVTKLQVDESIIDELRLVSWIWKDDERVPEHLRGTFDTGVLADAVERAFPTCVKINSETGLRTVDEGKLAVHLNLHVLERIRRLEGKE